MHLAQFLSSSRIKKLLTLTSLLLYVNCTHAEYPTDIRQVTVLGYQVDRQNWNRGSNWFDEAWTKHHANIWRNQPEAYRFHKAVVMFPFEWKQIYNDDSIVPTASQARDHGWKNYRWNNGGADDPIGIAKKHPRVKAGDAVVLPKIGFSATATPRPLPQFIKSRSDWWWIGGSTSTGPGAQEFLRLDKPEVRQHVENVLYAITQKWGSDPAVLMFAFGEYFNGPPANHPQGFNATKHKEAVKVILNNVIAKMPRDSNGKRQMLGLVSPNFGGNFERNDIITMGLVPVESNVELHFPVEGFQLNANQLYYASKGAHLLSKSDSRFYDLGKKFDWSKAPNNPFGLGPQNKNVPLEAQHYMWYRTHMIPTQSIIFGVGPGVGQSDIEIAIRKFGRGGSMTNQWGVSPILFEGVSPPKPPRMSSN